MLKAARAQDSQSLAEPLALADGASEGYLPAVAAVGEPMGACWELFRRRCCDSRILCAFRDRAIDAASRLTFPGSSCSGTEPLASLLRGLQRALLAAIPEVRAVCLTVPDHWPCTSWALPKSLVAAGWQPLLCVREGVAALGALDRLEADAVLLLSLGVGGAYSSCYSLKQGMWQRAGCRTSAAASGLRVRRLLYDWLVDEIIQRWRRDVRGSPEYDQALQDAIESTLEQLALKPEVSLHLSVGEQQLTLPMNWTRLADLAKPVLSALQTFLAQVCQDRPQSVSPRLALAWGELARWPPVVEQVHQLLTPRMHVRVLPPQVLSLGAARLCARSAEAQLPLAGPGLAGLDKNDGSYLPSFPGYERAFPLLEQLPEHTHTNSPKREPRLVRVSAGHDRPEMSVGNGLRLGRDPQSDWVLSESLYPEVSRVHAAVCRQGTQYFVRDLGSTNGTYLNGQLIDGEAVLTDGDIITLGSRGPSFRFEDAAHGNEASGAPTMHDPGTDV